MYNSINRSEACVNSSNLFLFLSVLLLFFLLFASCFLSLPSDSCHSFIVSMCAFVSVGCVQCVFSLLSSPTTSLCVFQFSCCISLSVTVGLLKQQCNAVSQLCRMKKSTKQKRRKQCKTTQTITLIIYQIS